MLGWPLPSARDWKSGAASKETLDKNARPLSEIAMLADWATPKASDGSGGRTTQTEGGGNSHLDLQARLAAFGPGPIGFLLGPNGWESIPASGQLNASHSRWIMGVPEEFDQCAIRASHSLKARNRGRKG